MISKMMDQKIHVYGLRAILCLDMAGYRETVLALVSEEQLKPATEFDLQREGHGRAVTLIVIHKP